MANPSDAALPQVGTDLQNVHSKADLAHVFKEFADIAAKPGELKSTLQNMQQANAKLPAELKMDGFQVVGFDPKQDGNNGAMFLQGPNHAQMALDVDGNEYKGTPSADGKRVSFDIAHPIPSPLADTPATDKGTGQPPATDKGTGQPPATDKGTGQPPATDKGTGQPPATDKGAGQPPATDKGAGQPPATDKGAGQPPATDKGAGQPASPPAGDGQPQTQALGNRGRQIDVSPDGKTGKYHITDKDSLWAVSADLLGKDNKHLSKQDVVDINAKIAEIAKDPRNHITNPNKIMTGHDLIINMPQQEATKPPEAPTKPPEAPTKPPEAPTKPPEAPTKPPEAPTKPPEAPTKPPEAPTKPPEAPTPPVPAGFDPSKDNPNLKPSDGVFNPLAPKGLIEGQPTQAVTSATDGIHERDVTTDAPDANGNVTRHYKGHFDDGTMIIGTGRTKFHADETVDAKGNLVTRDVNYDHDGATFTVQDGNGGSTSVQVEHIHTERQPDGTYKSTIKPKTGESFDVLSDSDGKPTLPTYKPSPSGA
jgi:hypothetical protein